MYFKYVQNICCCYYEKIYESICNVRMHAPADTQSLANMVQ